MFLSWIKRVVPVPLNSSRRRRRAARRLPTPTFRPRLESLEERTLLTVATPLIQPVSIAASGTTMGDGASSTTAGTVSANGQYEVFSSSANNLLPASSGITISGNSTNVYRRDLVNGTTSLVSVDSAGTGDVGTNNGAGSQAVTADGRYVAFASDSTDLTSDDTVGGVFVRDMTQGQTYLVSSNFDDFFSGISIGESNGQLSIAYAADDSSEIAQVYLATFQLGGSGDIQSSSLTTTRVSADSSGTDANGFGENPGSFAPVLSKDGSTLTFSSNASNLNVPGGYNDNFIGVSNLYLYSAANKSLSLVSAEPTTGTNATGNQTSSITELSLPGGPLPTHQTASANGQYVVFTSASGNLVPGLNVTDSPTSNVFRRDLANDTTSMVSINSAGTGGAGGFAIYPVITPDGRYVAFYSNAPNLTSAGVPGIFVRDMTDGVTYLVSNPAVADSVTFTNGGPSIAENSNGQLVIAYLVGDSSGNTQVYVSTLNLNSATGDINPASLTTKLVSATSSGTGANGFGEDPGSFLPLLSEDGNTLAFLSNATNLNGETNGNGYSLLFAYNIPNGTLTQIVTPSSSTSNTSVVAYTVSISDHGDISYALTENTGGGAALYAWNPSTETSTNIPIVPYPNGNPNTETEYGDINWAAISGDGSTVAWYEGNVFGQSYIFASNNWQSGPSAYQVSPDVGATINGNTVYSAAAPSLSENGQVIAYELAYGNNSLTQDFVNNNGTTAEVSAAYSGGDGNGDSDSPAVISDGSTVVYNSGSSNLVSGIIDFTPGVFNHQVYAYSVADKTNSLVSAKAPGLFTVDQSTYSPSLSDTGRYVAFLNEANDQLGVYGSNAYAENVQTGAPATLISGYGPDNGDLDVQSAVISGDGSTVAYANNGEEQVYSRNWLASSPTTTLVSVNNTGNGGGGNGYSGQYAPSISDNGQIIAFDSAANNLTTNDPNASGYTQIFLRNLATNTTTLASSNSDGSDGGNGNSTTPVLSAAGNVVVYNSQATNLVSGVTVPGSPPNNVYAFGIPVAENAASVSTVFVQWGTSGSAELFTAADGLRLLPAGRNTDLPWLNIQQLTITLDQPTQLSASDVSVSGVNGTNYGPVSVTQLSLTSYVIKLANPISKADRVTITIGNADIATYTRRMDVLPGDFNDDGSVSSADLFDVYKLYKQDTYNVFADFYGDGTVSFADVILVRALIGNKLPPLPPG